MLEKAQELKGLQSQLKIKDVQITEKKAQIGELQRELNVLQNSRQKILDKIERIKPKEQLRVTEHSLLRYIQRVKGIDLKEIEKEILEDTSLIEARKTLDTDGKFPLKDGGRVVIKNSTIVTVEK